MQDAFSNLPNNPEELRELLLQSRATIATLEQTLKHRDQEVQLLMMQLAKLKRMQFGRSSEKLDLQIQQLELRLEELETDKAPGPATVPVTEITRHKPVRKPLPEHLPRDTIHHASPCQCPDCGGDLKHIGIDTSEILEYVPARFMVIRHEREKLACGTCETIVQAPLPSRPVERGMAGPGLLSHVLVSKYADHLPLYRQSEIYGREGIDLSRSTLAGWLRLNSRPLSNFA